MVRKKMAENGKDEPTYLHVAFCKPLLKKHKNAASPLWHTNKPDLDNWNKLPQDCLVGSEVLFDDCKVSRLVLEKFYSCVPGVRITLGLLDDDDLPELGDLIKP
jgi:Holliday junction resolvase RusA-like endonuclease